MARNTKHAARKTLTRQIRKEESIHTPYRVIETGKPTRNVREGDQGYYW